MKILSMGFVFLLCLVMVSVAYGVPFEPPVVTITGYPVEEWSGGPVDITFDLEGRDCEIYLVIYSKDKGPMIPYQTTSAVEGDDPTGFDYHTFAGIDTCVVVTAGEPFTMGTGRTIRWNGRDKLGNDVPAGEYTYFLLANDASNPVIPFGLNFGSRTMRPDQYSDPDSLALGINSGGITRDGGLAVHWVQLYDEGTKLDTPRVWWDFSYWDLDQDTESGLWWAYQPPEFGLGSQNIMLDSENSDIIWYTDWDEDVQQCFIAKGLLNIDGPVEPVSSFGENGRYYYGGGSDAGVSGGCQLSGIVVAGSWTKDETYADLHVVDKESGELIRMLDAYEWFVASAEEYEINAGWHAGGPGQLHAFYHNPFRVANVGRKTCAHIAFNPFEDDDWLIWANMNGDYYLDHAFPCSYEEASWACQGFSASGGIIANPSMGTDKYDFCHYTNHGPDGGPAGITVLGPDGYGICGLMQLGQIAGYKWWSFTIDNDTAYDGVYTTYSGEDVQGQTGFSEYVPAWTGYDICMNVISSGVGVDDGKPLEYSLFNAPDPFNPATTIYYSLVKSGNVSLDVYNIMGQKVATLYEGNRDAGSYSVRWDASGFANGIYFTIMRTEGFTKSEKMMLVK